MSKTKNVHPDHYKTRGSLRQGEDIVQEEHRERFTRGKSQERKAPTPRKPEQTESQADEDRTRDSGEVGQRRKKDASRLSRKGERK